MDKSKLLGKLYSASAFTRQERQQLESKYKDKAFLSDGNQKKFSSSKDEVNSSKQFNFQDIKKRVQM